MLSVSRYSYTGGNKGWKRRRRLLVAAAAAPVVLRVGLAIRPAARFGLAARPLGPRGRRPGRGGATSPPEAAPVRLPIASGRRAARRRAPVLEGFTAARGRAPVVLIPRALGRAVLEGLTAARRGPVVTKPRALRRPIFEAAAAGRSIISEAAPASITKSAPSGTLITKAAAARVTEAAASRTVVATESAAPGPIVATEAAARRRPVIGPRAAPVPVAGTVRRLAPLALLRVGRLGLGGPLGPQALSFSPMSRDLGRPFLFVLATLGLLGSATFSLLFFPLAFLLGAQRVGGRFVSALLVLGPRAL